MTGETTTATKLRALSLSVLMVLSVFGGVAALSGTAAAANDVANASIDEPSAGNAPLYFSGDETLQVGYSYEADDPDATTVELVDEDDSTVAFAETYDDSEYAGNGSTKTVAVPMSGLTHGEYTVRVTISDDAGDVELTRDRPLVVDESTPTPDGLPTLDDTVVRPNGTVNVTYSYVDDNPRAVGFGLVDADGDLEATFEFDDSDYPGDGTERTRTLNLSTRDLEEGHYQVGLLLEDQAGNTHGPEIFTTLRIDAEPPTVALVDSDEGLERARVVFSEPVAAPDGTPLDVTAFTYTDGNDGGASAVVAVEPVAGTNLQMYDLVPNEPVALEDLGADSVGVREGKAIDRAGRPIATTEVTLTDETMQSPPVVDAAGVAGADAFVPIRQANEEDYPVRVIVTQPEDGGTLTVSMEGASETVSATTDVQAGQSVYTVSLNATTLADGDATVRAEYAEPSGPSSARTVGVVKDTTGPTVASAASNANVSEARLTFDEPVADVTPTAVTLSGVQASVSDVDRDDARNYTLELDAEVPESAIDSATVEVSNDVTDTFGNPANESASATLERTSIVDAEVTDGTVTVTVSATDTLKPEGTAVRANALLTTTDRLEFQDDFRLSLTESDFEASGTQGASVYEATFDAPSDGDYHVTVPAAGDTDTVAVDREDPRPVDAVVLDVTALGDVNDFRSNTRLRVRFSEPIDASDVGREDVSIESFDGEVVDVEPAGSFGVVDVIVDRYVQTGTEPNVTVDPSSYTELGGDGSHGAAEGTTLHTTKLHLEEGMNFVSVPAASGDLPLSELDTAAVDVVWAYDAEADEFVSWDPAATENDFTALEGGHGYIVVTEQSATLDMNVHSVAGAGGGATAAPAPNQVQLREGYNLVGHFQEDDQRVDAAFASVETGTPFKVLAQADGSSRLAYESYHAGDFEKLETGDAYWVFVQEDQVYTEAPFGVARAIDLYDFVGEEDD
jgi:surface glycoprotein (TIGR04207 family)